MGNGDVAVETAVEWATFQMSPASAEYMRAALTGVGALVCGRHLFDVASGWGGTHPLGVPIFVVTHTAPTDWPHMDTFTFVDSIDEAIAQARAAAGDKNVVVASAKVAQQCIDAGLVDDLAVDLVPIVLGSGVRWFENLASAPLTLGNPTVIEGNAVTHLTYSVDKKG